LFAKYFEFVRYFDLSYIHKQELNVKSDIISIKFNISVDKMYFKLKEMNEVMNIEENDYFKVQRY